MKSRSTKYRLEMCVGILVCLAFIGVTGFAGTTPLATGPSLVKDIRSATGVTCSAFGDHGIKAAFPYRSALNPPSDRVNIAVDQGVAESEFYGNYIERGINSISVDVSGSGHQPYSAEVQLTGVGRLWRFELDFPGTEGTVSTIQVPLKTGDGWKAFGTSGLSPDELSALLGGDLVDVSAINIVIFPEQVGMDYVVQHYIIDNLVLINDDGVSSLPADLTKTERDLQAALITRFGYGYGQPGSLTEEMRGWDGDGDGMADFMELWSEIDRNYANSIFSAEDIEVVGDDVNVTWTCVASNRYTVVRANSLNGSFLPVAGLNAMANETGYMTLTDTNAPAGCYYRIRKH